MRGGWPSAAALARRQPLPAKAAAARSWPCAARAGLAGALPMSRSGHAPTPKGLASLLQ